MKRYRITFFFSKDDIVTHDLNLNNPDEFLKELDNATYYDFVNNYTLSRNRINLSRVNNILVVEI